LKLRNNVRLVLIHSPVLKYSGKITKFDQDFLGRKS
jgi:hypothetical protein